MKLMSIGIVVLSIEENRKALSLAKKVKSILKGIGHTYYGATVEVINPMQIKGYNTKKLTISKKWQKELEQKDGYIFISETFRGEISNEYKEVLNPIAEEIKDKAAGFICFGEEEMKQNTFDELILLLTNYHLTIFNHPIFVSKDELWSWTFKFETEELLGNFLDQFAFLISGMKYMRNLKRTLTTFNE